MYRISANVPSPTACSLKESLLLTMMKGMKFMDRFESFVVAYPLVALYAFFCAGAISAFMIASKSRTPVFFVSALFIVGVGFLPTGYVYY